MKAQCTHPVDVMVKEELESPILKCKLQLLEKWLALGSQSLIFFMKILLHYILIFYANLFLRENQME